MNKNQTQKNEIQNGNGHVFYGRRTFGQRMADLITGFLGSWSFIIFQGFLIFVWMVLNVVAWVNNWDPYPFILLNLMLSFQAAFAAPVILMSQNRTAERDRKKMELDLSTDKKTLKGIEEIKKRLEKVEKKICG